MARLIATNSLWRSPLSAETGPSTTLLNPEVLAGRQATGVGTTVVISERLCQLNQTLRRHVPRQVKAAEIKTTEEAMFPEEHQMQPRNKALSAQRRRARRLLEGGLSSVSVIDCTLRKARSLLLPVTPCYSLAIDPTTAFSTRISYSGRDVITVFNGATRRRSPRPRQVLERSVLARISHTSQ